MLRYIHDIDGEGAVKKRERGTKEETRNRRERERAKREEQKSLELLDLAKALDPKLWPNLREWT